MASILLSLCLPWLASAFVDYGDAVPVSYGLSEVHTLKTDRTYSDQLIPLSVEAPVLIIDYGAEVAGFPFFDVASLSDCAQIEVKYAEDFTAFDNIYADGPWTFSNGLSSSFRTETFNISEPGRTQSFLVQGGQRWQTIRLLTNTTITLRSVGLKLTSGNKPSSEAPGKFTSSNPLYNKIWDLGPRVVQAACIDAGNAPSTWQITSDGAYILGQQTAQSAKGTSFGNYTLAFTTKIVRGGTGWRVGSSIIPVGSVFYLTTNYTNGNSFENVNRTLTPPNTLVYNYGYSIVNQSTLITGWNEYYSVDVTIEEHKWYNISATITSEGFDVSIDNTNVAFVPIAQAKFLGSSGSSYAGSGSPTDGTWGFGPWADQAAYFKDVTVTAQNGKILYSNPMTDKATLAEYNVAPLDSSICLDGAKRDRLVWAGDFYHTTRVLGSSTARWDFILGSIDFVMSWQRQEEPYKGFLPISAYMGARPEYKDAFLSNYAALVDYQDLFLAAIGHYYWSTADADGLKPHWKAIKDLVNARLAYIDPYSGLMAGEDAFYFLGPVNGSAITGLAAYAYKSLVPLAKAFNDTDAATRFSDVSSNLTTALNEQLWNPDLGVYSVSIEAPSNFSLTGIAWSILSGAPNSSQAASSIARLPELRLGVGYKTNSGDVDSDTTQLSPNTGGFLLEALLKAERDLAVQNLTVAKTMLDDFWSKMVTQEQYYSGASWEYLYPDGSPGIDLFTSLAHPWGAAPTYVLPEYVLGITATSPGYKTWAFEPLLGALGLTQANGTIVTPHGIIEAKWEIVDGGRGAIITASGPKDTTGLLVLPTNVDAECDGEMLRGGRFSLNGSKKTQVKVHSWKS